MILYWQRPKLHESVDTSAAWQDYASSARVHTTSNVQAPAAVDHCAYMEGQAPVVKKL